MSGAAAALVLAARLFPALANEPAPPVPPYVTPEYCADALAVYSAKPTVENLDKLPHCLDLPDARTKRKVYDGIIRREVWSDPRFAADAYPWLRKVVPRGRADPDYSVRGAADGVESWLDNWNRDINPASRRPARASRPETAGDRAARRVLIGLQLAFIAAALARGLTRLYGLYSRPSAPPSADGPP